MFGEQQRAITQSEIPKNKLKKKLPKKNKFKEIYNFPKKNTKKKKSKKN